MCSSDLAHEGTSTTAASPKEPQHDEHHKDEHHHEHHLHMPHLHMPHMPHFHHEKKEKEHDGEHDGIKISLLKPPAKYKTGWAKAVYKHLVEADVDGSGYLESSEFWAALEATPFRLESLRPNGKDAQELKVFAALEDAAKLHEGAIHPGDVMSVVKDTMQQRELTRFFRKIARGLAGSLFLIIVVFAVVQCATVFTATAALPQSSRDAACLASMGQMYDERECTSATPTLSDGHGSVLATAENLEPVPLYAVPALSSESLRRAKLISVSYFDEFRHGREVTLTSNIGGVFEINSTAVIFNLDRNMALEIINGQTSLDLGDGTTVTVCAADVSCSSLLVSEKDVDGLLEKATEALLAAGFAVPGDNGRRLDLCAPSTKCSGWCAGNGNSWDKKIGRAHV